MPRFVLQNNGTIRRIRCRIGGNQAWKQHEDIWTNGPGAADYRTRREQLECALAIEELFDDVGGSQPGRRHERTPGRKPASARPPSPPARSQAQAAFVAEAPVEKCKPRFKVVVSESGRMVAQYLN